MMRPARRGSLGLQAAPCRRRCDPSQGNQSRAPFRKSVAGGAPGEVGRATKEPLRAGHEGYPALSLHREVERPRCPSAAGPPRDLPTFAIHPHARRAGDARRALRTATRTPPRPVQNGSRPRDPAGARHPCPTPSAAGGMDLRALVLPSSPAGSPPRAAAGAATDAATDGQIALAALLSAAYPQPGAVQILAGVAGGSPGTVQAVVAGSPPSPVRRPVPPLPVVLLERPQSLPSLPPHAPLPPFPLTAQHPGGPHAPPLQQWTHWAPAHGLQHGYVSNPPLPFAPFPTPGDSPGSPGSDDAAGWHVNPRIVFPWPPAHGYQLPVSVQPAQYSSSPPDPRLQGLGGLVGGIWPQPDAGAGFSASPPRRGSEPAPEAAASEESDSPPRQRKRKPPLPSGSSGRRYVCPTCSAAFHSSGHLSRHSYIHAPDPLKPHACPIAGCARRFARSDNMKAHWRSHARRNGERGPPD
ncbi:hypothetical protein DFJ74DRAFT_722445 [Hyaloraphidium curvatum]|nr:hypothetical protein DFJ74DRAFT_722445 [Hyaloraphidium curvatum]